MSSNLQNSIWPNANGNLGENKVQIPDGINVTWPEGDALVHNFVFNKGKLVGFVDTKALIANDSKSTTFPYDYVNISLPSIAEGEMAYNYDQCAYVVLDGKVIKGDIPTNGEGDIPTDDDLEEINYKYMGCKTVDDIKAVDLNYLSNDIVNGVWIEWLGDLTNAEYMFYGCRNLKTFSSDLSSLTDGSFMFSYNSAFSEFKSDLPSLTNGSGMFSYCTNLESFSSDLSSLTDGGSMFSGCYNLTAINANLSSLTEGAYMFNNCKLDTASVQNIADTINSYNGILHIGIGKDYLSAEDETYLQQIRDKGWSIYANCNGYPNNSDSGYYGYAASASLASSTMTLDEIGESEMFAPKPYWAKHFSSDEQHARYVDSEGNFYNILGAQYIYVDDPETYGMFISEEDAAANMRLTKIVK